MASFGKLSMDDLLDRLSVREHEHLAMSIDQLIAQLEPCLVYRGA
jgi:hypothetical protein